MSSSYDPPNMSSPPPPPPPPPRGDANSSSKNQSTQDCFGNDEKAMAQHTIHHQYNRMSHTNNPLPQYTNQEHENYVLKEKRIRAKRMEEEATSHLLYHTGKSQYALNKSYSLSIENTRTESSDTLFDAGDWTPQDSSYGGAFPFCGWIPKRIRQAIEGILLVLAGFTAIYFIVTIAMMLTGAGKSRSRDYAVVDDDDHYIADKYDDYYQNAYNVYTDDVDDLFQNNDDDGNNKNDDGRLRNFLR